VVGVRDEGHLSTHVLSTSNDERKGEERSDV
jgi:hypothetical protein